MPACLDDLAQLHVQALDGVGHVSHAPDVGREDEERRDVLPGPLPGRDDHWLLCPPRSVSERLQSLLGSLLAGGGIDWPQRGADGLTILPARVIQAVADQMHDAGLHRRARKGGADGLGQALQTIDHGDQDVLAPSGLEFIEDLEPELGSFGLLDPQAQHVALAIGLHAQGQVNRLVADPAIVAAIVRSITAFWNDRNRS